MHGPDMYIVVCALKTLVTKCDCDDGDDGDDCDDGDDQ